MHNEHARCGSCRFLGETRHQDEVILSSSTGCRRHAPGSGYWSFPPVNPDEDWCGEYEERKDRASVNDPQRRQDAVRYELPFAFLTS